MKRDDIKTIILGILDQVANEVSGELDLPTVLRKISRLIKNVTDYSHLVIGLIDEERRFNWVFQEGYSPEALASIELSIDQGVIGRAVRSKEVIAVGDVAEHPDYVPVPVQGGEPPRSELAVPLVSKDKAIGVIALESAKPHAFREDHRMMMHSIATHLAAAVVNARLHERTLEQIKIMEVIEQIGREITSVLDLEGLLHEIARLTRLVIDYQAFGVFLVDRERGEFAHHLAIGYDQEALKARPVKLDEGIRGKVLRFGRPVVVNDVLNDPAHVHIDLEIDDVIRSQMVVPLLTKNKIVGVLVLGNVKEGFYSDQHLRIASGLGTQIAIALENARVFEEVSLSEERLREELRIAREVQLSMLPVCCPLVEGFELDAESKPAVAVGGDFYDFIQLPEERWGIVIGDVSGYGLPGALVMTSAREVIRVYAEFDPDPEELMARADRHLSRNLSGHMFVALLYGILDPKKRTFTFCNAGLIEPALIREGRARFLSTPANRMPLGKLPELGYRQKEVQLREGDSLILSTDGVIEAWDSKERQFGFRRFLRTLSQADAQAGNTRNASAILIERVFNTLDGFVGSSQLQDDATILAIKAY